MQFAHKDITRSIIGAAFEVHRVLGYGFLERVYQRALQAELALRGMAANIEHPRTVTYKGITVGDYRADLWVEHAVMVELKTNPEYNPRDEAQLLNELKAASVSVGLLINFGRHKAEFKRMVF